MTLKQLESIKKMPIGPDKRDIDSLVRVFKKLADDLESGTAIEGDFNIELEDKEDYTVMDITIETYYIKPGKKTPEPKILLG